MPRKQDKRVQHTIEVLHDTFIRLMYQKNGNRISVRELCTAAGVNRSTFYVYYQNMDELLEEIESNAYEVLETIFQDENSGAMQLQRSMEFIQQNKKLFWIMISRSESDVMERFYQIMERRFIRKSNLNHRNSDVQEAQYLYVMIYTGTVGVIQKWLENDCREDPARIAKMIWQMILFCEKHDLFL